MDGATGYVLHVSPLSGRIPAADKTIKILDNSTEIEVPIEGKFKWDIQAVANLDSKGAATGFDR